MAREKRPAEKIATAPTKRQKLQSNNGCASSPVKCNKAGSNKSSDGGADDEEWLTQSIQSRFDKMKSDHAKRIKTSEEFEDRIKKQQAILNEVIVSATDEIEGKRTNFRSRMLPILTGALTESTPESEAATHGKEVLSVEYQLESTLLRDAISTVNSCSELIACYRKALAIPLMTSTTLPIRTTLEGDRDETMRAFGSAKKMTINRLQAGLADKIDDLPDEYVLSDDEYHLARKVLVHEKGSTAAEDVSNIGTLLHDFGKVMGRLQDVADGWSVL